jgi:hypothetical protein
MAILIEKDSGTANQRTIHFRIFTSNGTTPDTGVSNDSVIVARGSTTTFIPNLLVAAVHSAQGMYSIQLSASDVSNLGQHAVYYTQGDFPQHVAAFDVVNFNPYSTQSNLSFVTDQITAGSVSVGGAAKIAGASADSVWDEPRVDHMLGSSYGIGAQIPNAGKAQGGASDQIKLEAGSSATTDYFNDCFVSLTSGPGAGQTRSIFSYSGSGLTAYVAPNWLVNPTSSTSYAILPQGTVDIGQVSSSTTAADNLKRFYDGTGYTSLGTVGVSRIAAGTYSGVTVGSAATILAGTYSGVTLGINNIAPGTYSGATVGSLATIVAGDYGSSITFGVSQIKAGTYSGVTVGSGATILPGGIVATSFGASAIDAAALATDAGQEIADRILLRNIAGGADSGRTVGESLFVLRNRVNATSSVGTVYQNDDTASAWTFSITTGANPIAQVDPT